MNYELLFKMELEAHENTRNKYVNTQIELIKEKHELMERVNVLETELETIINKHNAERLTGSNITIKCNSVNIYG